MPERIQRRRTAGWRMPDNAVYVGRPTEWGNPFAVGETVTVAATGRCVRIIDAAFAVQLYRAHIAAMPSLVGLARLHLAGRDLACWCPLEDAQGNPVPCHADVLLEIANGGAP